MTTIPTQRPPETDLSDLTEEQRQHYEIWTEEEFEAAIQSALDRLGTTREDLARQAREDDFQSIAARNLWVSLAP